MERRKRKINKSFASLSASASDACEALAFFVKAKHFALPCADRGLRASWALVTPNNALLYLFLLSPDCLMMPISPPGVVRGRGRAHGGHGGLPTRARHSTGRDQGAVLLSLLFLLSLSVLLVLYQTLPSTSSSLVRLCSPVWWRPTW